MTETNPVPVLLMVRELNYGGIERDATKIAIHLDKRRFRAHVASYNAHGVRYEELKRANIPVLHVPVTSLLSKSAMTSALRFGRYIRRHGIRVVHALDSSATFAAPIARAMGVPAVLSSMLGFRDLMDDRTRKHFRTTDRIVDAVVVNCQALKRHLVEDENVPANRVEVCYNGVETSVFYPAEAPRTQAFAGASLVIGSVSVLRPEKALHLLQEAFARVCRAHPGLRLAIVGDGPELPSLVENASRLGISGASVFLPATPEVAPILRAIDIFVLCSTSEAFSNALLEALACGCCAVGSRVGGTPELIGENERGLLFESGNAEDLARKLNALMGDPGLRATFGSRAAQFARTLSIEAAAARTAEIYESILSKKNRA